MSTQHSAPPPSTSHRSKHQRGCVSPRINLIHVYIQFASVIGLTLALYALYVEHQVSVQGPKFKALCDLGPRVSCSDVLTSDSSHLFFDIPNAALGTLFYALAFAYKYIPLNTAVKSPLFTAACTFSVMLSAYLATVLYRMNDACVLCISTYFVNGALLVLSIAELNRSRGSAMHSKQL